MNDSPGTLMREGKEQNMGMEDLYQKFSDVHPNIVLKTDVLRQGLKISATVGVFYRSSKGIYRAQVET
jgi:hypothetical protein